MEPQRESRALLHGLPEGIYLFYRIRSTAQPQGETEKTGDEFTFATLRGSHPATLEGKKVLVRFWSARLIHGQVSAALGEGRGGGNKCGIVVGHHCYTDEKSDR